MQMQTKSGGVLFEHDDEYRGEVSITRGGATVTVPMDALRKLMAEAVRHDLIARIAALKPDALLRGQA